jgi:hypothetical protein
MKRDYLNDLLTKSAKFGLLHHHPCLAPGFPSLRGLFFTLPDICPTWAMTSHLEFARKKEEKNGGKPGGVLRLPFFA